MNASNPASYSLFTLWREIMSLFEATGHIGLPYLYLGCGFAKKALFFYFSSFLLCDAESTTTDNIVFRKPTSPPLALRKAFFESLLVNSLYDPFGSPCRGQKPFPKGAPPRFSKTYPSFLTVKEGSTSSPKPPPPQKEGDVTAPPRSSNRYAIRLADHQRSAPGFCAGWDRLADLDADSLLLLWLLTDCFCLATLAADSLLLHCC